MMKSVVMFSVGAVVFHRMWFAAGPFIFFADGPLLLDDVERQRGATITNRNIIFFFVWGHDEVNSFSLWRCLTPYILTVI